MERGSLNGEVQVNKFEPVCGPALGLELGCGVPCDHVASWVVVTCEQTE